jgi:hypothetical protein
MRENLARIVRNQIENLRKELLKTLDERDTHGAVAKLLGVRTEAPKDFNISEKQ